MQEIMHCVSEDFVDEKQMEKKKKIQSSAQKTSFFHSFDLLWPELSLSTSWVLSGFLILCVIRTSAGRVVRMKQPKWNKTGFLNYKDFQHSIIMKNWNFKNSKSHHISKPLVVLLHFVRDPFPFLIARICVEVFRLPEASIMESPVIPTVAYLSS